MSKDKDLKQHLAEAIVSFRVAETHQYTLAEDGMTPVPCPGVREWAEWMEAAKESGAFRVAEDDLGEVKVSTVFLGLNHGLIDRTPILWETMIFGGEHDGWLERYATKAEAIVGHEQALALVWNKAGKPDSVMALMERIRSKLMAGH